MIIIIRFGKNYVWCPKYIDIYEFRVGTGGTTWSTKHFLFIIQKNGKSTRAWPILESNSTSFLFNKFFPRMYYKKFTKRGPHCSPFLFLYEVSILVLIDFIAILLTPGIFLRGSYNLAPWQSAIFWIISIVIDSLIIDSHCY